MAKISEFYIKFAPKFFSRIGERGTCPLPLPLCPPSPTPITAIKLRRSSASVIAAEFSRYFAIVAWYYGVSELVFTTVNNRTHGKSCSTSSYYVCTSRLVVLCDLFRLVVFFSFLASDSMLSALYAIARPSVRPSVCPSVTRVDQSKTVEARIMRFSPYSSPIPLVCAG